MKSSVCYYSLIFCLIVLVVFTYSATASCEDNALGIESKTIPDGQLTSSSSFNASTPAKNARLNFVGLPWCAVESSTPLYLQVDLGSLHAVCAVATQGNSKADQWVETYQLKMSTDGTTWTDYEEGGQVREFQGNADSNTTVKQALFEGVVSRYVRVVPKTCREFCCLRVELYGAPETSCQNTAVGIADRSKIPNHRMTATTYLYSSYVPYNGRFSVTICAWEAEKAFTGNDYLQVDLGAVHFICALATKGNGCKAQEWTKTYKIYLSLDNKSWNIYKENGVVKAFIGNTDRTTVKKNNVPSLPRAKFIRFWPTEVKTWALLRVEVYGAVQACRSSLGMEDNSIKDSQITAQPNVNISSNGRLYNTSTWCSSDTNAGYLQVDLGQVSTVTGVASQGHHSSDKWVKTYKISYKYDSSLSASWQDYKLKDSGPVMTFDGNVNKNGVRVNWFPVPVVARYIRVIADSWTPSSSGPCLRIDLYGCDRVLLPVMTLTRKVLTLAQGEFVDVVCKVTSQSQLVIQWWLNNTDVTSLSSGVIRSDDSMNGVSVSILRVNFTSVDDIAAKYDCVREGLSSRVVACTAFSCSAFYAGIKSETIVTRSTAVAVTLYVPARPSPVKVSKIQATTATLQWDTNSEAPDTGSVLSYIVKYHPTWSLDVTSVKAAPLSKSLELSNLIPHTKYSVEISSRTIDHEDPWKVLVNFTTADVLPPRIIKEQSTTHVVSDLNTTAVLRCYATGGQVSYSWSKDGKSLASENIVENNLLIIRPQSQLEFGNYMCNVTNSAGSTTQMFLLEKYKRCTGVTKQERDCAFGNPLVLVSVCGAIILVLVIIVVCLTWRLRRSVRRQTSGVHQESPRQQNATGDSRVYMDLQPNVQEYQPLEPIAGPPGQQADQERPAPLSPEDCEAYETVEVS